MADFSQIANYQVKGRASNDSLRLPDRVLRFLSKMWSLIDDPARRIFTAGISSMLSLFPFTLAPLLANGKFAVSVF